MLLKQSADNSVILFGVVFRANTLAGLVADRAGGFAGGLAGASAFAAARDLLFRGAGDGLNLIDGTFSSLVIFISAKL